MFRLPNKSMAPRILQDLEAGEAYLVTELTVWPFHGIQGGRSRCSKVVDFKIQSLERGNVRF